MKGIENIQELITAEAQKKADSIVAAARENANKADAEADSRAAEIVRDGKKKAEAEAEAFLESERTEERLAGGKAELARKQTLLKNSFAVAEKRLADLMQDDYMSLLETLIKKATADGAGGEIVLSEKDLNAFGTELCDRVNKENPGKALTLCPTAEKIGKGAIVRRARIELNCQLSAIISHIQDQSANMVSDILFRG